MPTFYNYTEDGQVRSIDDVFVPADAFRQGTLFTWGYNQQGQLGINQSGATPRSTPVTTSAGGANWKQVNVYGSIISAIKTDGTLWTWGQNYGGDIGINAIGNRCTPVTTFAGGTDWKQGSGTAAIKTDGTLWTWGSNAYGKLGTNDTTQRPTPVTTFAGGTNWKQVSGTAAIKTDGTLWTWGYNNNGQLGINVAGTTTNRTTPVTTFAGGTNWKQVSGEGSGFMAAIKTDGTLWTWGYNTEGQLGINIAGTGTNRCTPVTTFAGGTNWKQVACGDFHIAAIKTDGTLWSWGRNGNGQLGINNSTSMRCTPVTTFAGGTNWKQVDCGSNHTAAIKTDGTLWTWGGNAFAATLGINVAIEDIFTPVTTFAGGTNWKQVSCGIYQTTAITYIDDYQ